MRAVRLEISNSELATWRRCRRKWFISYFLQKGKQNDGEAGVRQLGSRIHTALEGYYGYGIDPVETIREIYAEDREAAGEAKRMVLVDELTKELDLAVRMLEGYMQWVAEEGVDEGLEVIQTEHKLCVPLGVYNSFDVYIKGRLDMRMRREFDGATLYMDHKTVGGFENDPDVIHLDGQFRFYNLLEHLDAKQRGVEEPNIDGGIRNMIRRVKRTASAKPPFYKREDVRHNHEDLRSTLAQTVAQVREITAARLLLGQSDITDSDVHNSAVYPNVIMDRCKWDCDFKAVCSMMSDGSDWLGMLNGEFTDADPYQHYTPSSRWAKLKEGGSR